MRDGAQAPVIGVGIGSGAGATGRVLLGIDHPFFGYALNAVDAKGRVSVPSDFRELIRQRCVLYAPGDLTVRDTVLDMGLHEDMNRLQVFDAIGKRQLAHDLREGAADLPAAERRRANAEAASNELGTLEKVSFDSAGRMQLPPMLREFGGIKDKALFWGTGDYFEIWNPEAAIAAWADQPRKRMTAEYLLKSKAAA